MTSLFEPITKEDYDSGVATSPQREPHPLWRQSATPEVITYDCEFCGHCETPNNCAWSIVCPVCNVEPREQCVATDGRITGLHAERWKGVKS